MNNPCFLLPTYNDGATIETMARKLSVYGLPILVVDDGSLEESRVAVEEVAAKFELVRSRRRAKNGGKGAAVVDGLMWARKLGHSHAIQIDSDDQHDTDNVPAFLEACERDPEALVLATPVFGDEVPKGRLIGRQISRFWVVLETLSTAISDPLCGFRGYPVQATTALLDRNRQGLRMDFDPEIAVRLYWDGLRVVNIPSRVRYPEGGQSSFRVFRDNVGISWLHTRLFLGMFLRIPRLVRRWWTG